MIDLFYILRTLVYVQSFLWLYLIDYDLEINDYFIRVLFPISLGILYLMLDITGFQYNQYTNPLLKFYTILLFISYRLLSYRYDFKENVCLAFLSVFINSYYWESMLHLNAIIFHGLSFNQIVQMFHLIPAYFLVKKLEFINKKTVIKLLIYGLMISNLNILSLNFLPIEIFGVHQYTYRPYINNLTRLLCLLILLYILNNHVYNIKKRGDKVTPFPDSTQN